MNKLLLIVFTIIFLPFQLIALNLTKEEIDFLKNNPTITLGYSTSFEPLFIEKEKKQYVGVIPDLYSLISKKLNVKFIYKIDSWNNIINETSLGNIDIIPLMAEKTAIKKDLLITSKIYSHFFKIFTQKSNKYDFESILDLKGLRIAYVGDIIILDEYLKKYKNDFSLVATNTPFEAFDKVLNNKADVAIVFNSNGYYMIKEKFLTTLESLFSLKDLQIDSVSAITPKKPILKSIITKALNSISYGEKIKIIENWTKIEKIEKERLKELLTEKEKTYLNKLKILKVQVENDWIPYNFQENNIEKGYSNDYMKLLGNILGVKIDFVKGFSWNEYVLKLKNKELDLISNMVITDKRKDYFIFSDAFTFGTYKSIFSNNSDKYFTFEELSNKRLGLVKGNYEEEIIRNNYENIIVKVYNSNIQLIEALLSNEVDAITGNKIVIDYLINENFITSIFSVNVINDLFPLKGIRLAFHKDNKLLKSIIDKAMSTVDEKRIEELKEKWKINLKNHSILANNEKELLEKNELIIYYNSKGWYPFIFFEDDTVKGISVDFWNEITKDLDIKVSYKATESFNKILNLIKITPNSLITSTSFTKDRAEYASFTKPYASFPIAIVTNLKEDFLLDLRELEGKTVAVGKNYSAHKLLLQHYPKINFVPVKNIQTALDLLANGKVYAAADILPVINYELNRSGFTNLKISGTSKFNFDVQIMLNKENENLTPILNKLIDNFDGNIKQTILNKWTHHNKVEKVDYKLAYIIAIISFIIITFILYRQFVLKKQKLKIENEIKKATKELKELNQMHEETQQLAKIATIKKNLNTNNYWVSKQLYRIFEFDESSIINEEKLLSVLNEENRVKLNTFFIKNEKYKNSLVNYDNIIIEININNKIKYLDLFLSYCFNEKHEAYERKVIVQDVTEKILLKEKEERKEALLIQQSKLASMGEMIGAIAHQWRQPLNELSIRIQKLKYSYAKEEINEEFIKGFIQKNKRTIDFMSKTIDDFRNFFRIDKEKKRFYIKETIEEVINIQSAQLKNNHIKIELEGKDFEYEGYKTEFQQVIINIISNSKDALVKNRITEPKIKVEIKEDRIEIKDNGGGIDKEIINRVFEPYFTTKQQGEGTGMGLYMSKMIIEDNMGGRIDIKNKNQGVLITIDLKDHNA